MGRWIEGAGMVVDAVGGILVMADQPAVRVNFAFILNRQPVFMVVVLRRPAPREGFGSPERSLSVYIT
jgi:hypothetical protein